VTAFPAGWLYVAEFGIRQMTTAAGQIAASVGAGQDELDQVSSLPEYIEKQKKLIGKHLKEAKFAGPQAIAFAGADEAQLLFVRHNLDSARIMLHAQTYVRLGLWLGIVTLTTLENQLRAVRPGYEAFVKGLRISPSHANVQPTGS
jgi:hypothetical protein